MAQFKPISAAPTNPHVASPHQEASARLQLSTNIIAVQKYIVQRSERIIGFSMRTNGAYLPIF
jgi:hypothetical protein